MRSTTVRYVFFAGLLSLSVSRMTLADDQWLGAVERPSSLPWPATASPHLRVLFRKDGDSWLTPPQSCIYRECAGQETTAAPAQASWLVVEDGKPIGSIAARAALKDSSGQRGPGDDSATAIAAAFANEPGRPALAAITVPYSDDPDSWHVTPGLPPKILAALRAQFRKRYPSLCEGRGDEVGVAPQDPFDYSNEDIKLVAGYISGKGWLLARLRLDEVVDCGRDDSGYGIDDAWYAVRPDGAVIYLDSGLELVDIGDYDHDGSSELLFRLSRYNIRGYELYYRNFARQAANLYLAY